MPLTSGELSQIRADMERDLLTDECVIQRPIRTPNDSGGWTETSATVATVACRVSRISEREIERGGRLASEADMQIVFPALTDVRGADAVVVNDTTYQVSGAPQEETDEMVRVVFVKVAG